MEQQPDPTGAKILDGTVRVLADFGVKRATVELVARYAGVSHMTIYRRWPSKADLLGAAVVAELTTVLDTAFDGPSGTSFAERTLEAFTEVVWTVQGHPVVVRELGSEAGEQSPLLSSSSDALMETTLPLIVERLRLLAANTADAPDSLDPVADVFLRLGHSLIVVKRPGRPLSSRAAVADYARVFFGPYLSALSGVSSRHAEDAPEARVAQVVDLGRGRSERARRYRPHLQIAAASLLGAVTLGGGFAAALNGTITLPLITPAGTSESPEPAAPPAPAREEISWPQAPAGPAQPVGEVLAPAPRVGQPAGAEVVVIPRIAPPSIPVADVGSPGGNAASDDIGGNPRPVPRELQTAPEPPDPQPQPAVPAARPPGPPPPGPRPPAPGPQPPGPRPPGPGPQQSGPPPPGPRPPAPGPQQSAPGPRPPGPGPQQSGPGPRPPGPQPNRQAAPGN